MNWYISQITRYLEQKNLKYKVSFSSSGTTAYFTIPLGAMNARLRLSDHKHTKGYPCYTFRYDLVGKHAKKPMVIERIHKTVDNMLFAASCTNMKKLFTVIAKERNMT